MVWRQSRRFRALSRGRSKRTARCQTRFGRDGDKRPNRTPTPLADIVDAFGFVSEQRYGCKRNSGNLGSDRRHTAGGVGGDARHAERSRRVGFRRRRQRVESTSRRCCPSTTRAATSPANCTGWPLRPRPATSAGALRSNDSKRTDRTSIRTDSRPPSKPPPPQTTPAAKLTVTTLTLTALDGAVAGDAFRIAITRVANDGTNDTMTGDAELLQVELVEA